MVPKVGLLALSAAGIVFSVIGVSVGSADGRSTFNPDLTERVVIEDGFGNRRDDMTLRYVLDSTERLAELSEAEPGTSELYGLLPSGEWGVVGVCVERPMTQRSLHTQRVLTEFFGGRLPATFNDCGPAPGSAIPAGE